MVERRTLLSTGWAAGVGALLGASPASAARPASPASPASGASAQSDDSDGSVLVAQAIDELRESLERQAQTSPALLLVRDKQHAFLKANHKFPDFVEIGIGIWEEIYDWHVTNQQTLSVRRTEEGVYVMTVMFTALILRPDQAEGFTGIGFDAQQLAGA